jgi:hypothetical protein
MTEQQLTDLGWQLVKQYTHDGYHTNRYALGPFEIEFTYEGDQLITCDVTIKELKCLPINYEQAKVLTQFVDCR